jgi:hypothetical protein
MKHIVEAGTDAAALLLFDPAALPKAFDVRSQEDPASLYEELDREGKLRWINTGADGRYLLHAYVDEPIPSFLQPFAQDRVCVETFCVPSGQLYFAGAEYGFRKDDSLLRKYPHMGGSFTLKPGSYQLVLLRTKFPEGMPLKVLKGEVPRVAFWLFQSFGWAVGSAVLAFIGLVVALFQIPLAQWFALAFPPLGFLALLPFLIAKSDGYQRARERYRSIEREFPSIVAHLGWFSDK